MKSIYCQIRQIIFICFLAIIPCTSAMATFEDLSLNPPEEPIYDGIGDTPEELPSTEESIEDIMAEREVLLYCRSLVESYNENWESINEQDRRAQSLLPLLEDDNKDDDEDILRELNALRLIIEEIEARQERIENELRDWGCVVEEEDPRCRGLINDYNKNLEEMERLEREIAEVKEFLEDPRVMENPTFVEKGEKALREFLRELSRIDRESSEIRSTVEEIDCWIEFEPEDPNLFCDFDSGITPDTDGDGVDDCTDSCPHTYGEDSMGCPLDAPAVYCDHNSDGLTDDADSDGVDDCSDSCPLTAGDDSMGCPMI